MNQSHRGSSRRYPKGAPPAPAARTLIELSIKRAGGSTQPPTPNTNTVHSRQSTSIQYRLVGWVGGKPRRHTRAPLAQRARSHRYSRGCAPPAVDRLTRGQIQSRALQIWLISELLLLMHMCMRHLVACVWPALTLSLSPPRESGAELKLSARSREAWRAPGATLQLTTENESRSRDFSRFIVKFPGNGRIKIARPPMIPWRGHPPPPGI